MKTKLICWAIAMVLLASPLWAGGNTAKEVETESDFLYDFLKGSYLIIGRQPQTGATYAGRVIVRRIGDKLEVIRKIGNKQTKAVGRIETATSDNRKVLRVGFEKGGLRYEATYIIGSDLDNYARLTGYVYLREGETKAPGLEAWFIDHRGQ